MSTTPRDDSDSLSRGESTAGFRSPEGADSIGATGSDRETVVHTPAGESAVEGAADWEVRSKQWPSVPGFEILEEIGRGGMGVVYRARQVRLKRLVALKMILAGAHAGAEELNRFRAEAEAVARLQHPNIVQVFEVGEHNGLPYLVLEYAGGGNLRQATAGSLLPPVHAAELVEQLALAMEAVHRCGVVHRDLKPANVLLAGKREDGQGTGTEKTARTSTPVPPPTSFIPKISDFGLAKRLDEDSAQTQTGQVLGTPSFMAPEQAAGRIHNVGPAADVYSLGAILYDLLTGRPPFKGASVQETIEQVCHQEPVRPAQLQPKVPRDLETICLKCLHKEPARRYASAEQLGADLRRFLNNEPILARPVSRPERLWRWCRRNPVIASLAGLSAAFLAVMAVTLVWAYLTTSAALEQTETALDRETEALKTVEGEKMKVEKARGEAVLRQTQAEAARESEKAARRETEEKLIRLTVSNGNRCWDEGDPAGALLHFLSALERDPEQGALNRLRAGMALHDCARPVPLGFHGGEISQVAFSPDGRRAITAGKDGLARVWDVEKGALFTELRHTAPVSHAFFHPQDNDLVLTATGDGAIQVWQLSTAQPSGPRLDLKRTPFHVAFNHDGSQVIAAGGDRYGTLQAGTPEQRIFQGAGKPPLIIPGRPPRNPTGHAQVWERRTGVVASHFRVTGWFNQAVFSRKGNRVATAGAHGTSGVTSPGEARVWDISGTPVTPPLVHRYEVNTAAFSPDGARLVTASGPVLFGGGEARVWDAETGAAIGRPMPHDRAVTQAAFSPDGTRVVTASLDGTARVWDAATGEALGPLLRHTGALTAGLFSPDGARVLTCSKDGTARLWDAVSGEPLGPVLHHGSQVTAAAFSPDGRRLATATLDGAARLWDLAAGFAPPRRFRTFGPALAALPTPDGRHLLAVSGRQGSAVTTYRGGSAVAEQLVDPDSLHLWDRRSGEMVRMSLPFRGRLSGGWISPDGRRFATLGPNETGGGTGVATVWKLPGSVREGEPFKTPALFSVAFASDGRALAIAAAEKPAPGNPREKVRELRVWDVARQAAAGPVIPCTGRFNGAFLSAEGRLLVSLDGALIRLWDVATGREMQEALPQGQPVDRVELGAGGRRLLVFANPSLRSTEATPPARVWDLGARTSVVLEHHGSLGHAAFSPEADRVATAGFDQTARIWNAASGKPLTPPLRHQGAVTHVAFSRDGRLLATASDDRTARVWDSATGEALTPPLRHSGAVRSVAFAADSGSLVTACQSGEAYVWDLPRESRSPRELAGLAKLLAGRRLDDTGGLIPLEAGALERSWPEVSRSHKADLACSAARAGAWLREQAEESERRKEWFAAAVWLGHMIREEPAEGKLYVRRARANAEAGRWEGAASDFAEAVRLKQEEEDVLRGLALSRLAAGNAAGYRQTCKTLLDRLVQPDGVKSAGALARACVLAPDALADFGPLLAQAEKINGEKSTGVSRYDVHGAALVRAGRLDEAIQRLTPAREKVVADNVWNWLFLALACQRQGKADAAGQWLDRAARWFEEASQGQTYSRDSLFWSRLSWEDRLGLQLLRREAEATVRPARP